MNYCRDNRKTVKSRVQITLVSVAVAVLLLLNVPVGARAESDFMIKPGPMAQEELQEALILVEPGQTIELTAGVFMLTDGLSLDVDDVTVKGQGMNKSILSFKGQKGGSEGLLVTSD